MSSYPSHGVLNGLLQHVGAATHIPRGQQLHFLLPTGSGQQVLGGKDLFGHDHEVLYLKDLETKAVSVFLHTSPAFILNCCLSETRLEVDLISACFIFSSLTLVSQMWMSVKLVPTTATCMPHVWMSPEASSAAAEKAGWETASNVLVSLRRGKPFSKGQHFCVALPCTHVNQHSNGHSLFAFYLFSCKSKLSLVAGIIPVWAFP